MALVCPPGLDTPGSPIVALAGIRTIGPLSARFRERIDDGPVGDTCHVLHCWVPRDSGYRAAERRTRASPQYIFKTTTTMGDSICYWAGASYSNGAQIRLPERDRDPHVGLQFFTCHEGNWTRE